MNQPIRIALIDDHELILWALSTMIKQEIPDVELYEARSFDKALALLERSPMDLIVLDVDIPGGNNTKMITELRHISPQVRILVHTAMNEEDYSIQYLSAGANGFLSKSEPNSVIAKAVRTVLKGERYMSEKTQSLIANNYLKTVTSPEKQKVRTAITPREAQIITLLLSGKWTKEIAAQLDIKWSTVSTHKLSIFEKFGVTSIIQLYKKIEKERPELISKI
ncbi:DNA-binding response regulator [Dyadobacter luteus]|uniref:DNA-binding response regulator n=1 Tax=Dyadobacter luteus TaxID=2259619 RepID=A0A3D8Y384_9BACT|nr:response regulator transcription factor [Dyadobacter luteus]REA56524.1 DNA-binding response regulator [Dyadobacter luteus]